MDISAPTPLLGELSPEVFMRRHWQKKPLLVRSALPDAPRWIERAQVLNLAAVDGVESRLIERRGAEDWSLRHGPFSRRALPSLQRAGWTLLVQGADLHLSEAHHLLSRFRFLPNARLDDVMISVASDGGGVGPHVDSYDVFLVQLQGRRRWRIAAPGDARLVDGLPLKILQNFQPEHEWLLEAGDMLYLPPGWGHDGVAEGDCMTASIGFRAPARLALGREVLQALLDGLELPDTDPLYKDRQQAATREPGRLPEGLHHFAADAVQRLLADPRALSCALGEVMSEPKPNVWFEGGESWQAGRGVCLDARSRMVYDDVHVFLNGESFRAAGRDARLMRILADEQCLDAGQVARLSAGARELLDEWLQAGWLRPLSEEPGRPSSGPVRAARSRP